MSSNNRDNDDFDENDTNQELSFLEIDSNNQVDGTFDLTFQTSDKERTSIYIPRKMKKDLNMISDVKGCSNGYILYRSFMDRYDYWVSQATIIGNMNQFKTSDSKYGWVDDLVDLIDYIDSVDFDMKVKKMHRKGKMSKLIDKAESIESFISSIDNAVENSKLLRFYIKKNHPNARETLQDALDTILDELDFKEEWYG